MVVKTEKLRKRFKIEILLKKVRWSKSLFARELKVTHTAVEQFLKNGAKTIWKRIKYTEAYNRVFEEDYSCKELFRIVD